MLRLKNITKDYKIGSGSVHALRGVSMDFRKSEFVAVLGQSGCGKTTLLNIIGGLDRYTEGDLVINGKSTKQFKNSDWDSYRNHSIGFVFQSYNLIPHQTVLSNVELALTLSGVSKKERRKRAKDALIKVGLGDQLNKKPNQMSGGQMQRVAIARALVNDPDILLADEPTGALDSETSVQIMEILKEISKDKLIIMVTHNPELADKYSTRIIKLLDGKVTDDSDPYDEEKEEKPDKDAKKIKRPSMSFFTALSLSFNNLLTKKGRTFMTSFAGSIGIIGIALILALSSGSRAYIRTVEESTLSSYPLSIKGESVDMTSMISSMVKVKQESESHETEDKIYSVNVMTEMMNAMMTQIQSNDLKAFKAYIEGDGKEIRDYVSDIKYFYSTPLNVYRTDLEKGIYQVNPSTMLDDLGMSSAISGSDAMSTITNSMTGVWDELLDNDGIMESQYKVLKGRFPKAYNEVVIMVNDKNEIADYSLYCLGLMDSQQVIDAVKEAMKGNTDKIELNTEQKVYTFDELMDMKFKLLVNTDYYEKQGDIWVDKSDDKIYLTDKLEKSEDIYIVGIIKPDDNSILSSNDSVAVGYTAALTEYLVNKVNESEIVKEQKDNPTIDIFTGNEFKTDEDEDVKVTMEDIMAFIATLPEQQQAEISAQLQQALAAGMTEEQIAEAFAERLPNKKSDATYDSNMLKLGVSSLDSPIKINIYPKDFESKEKIVKIIDDYNEKVRGEEKEELMIRYTDLVGLMMSSVTTIIDAISYILIAFVAISLVVSSIMIGIITYISVLERTKEIGILRAMGASKKDVSRVFNAETFIIGLVAGVIGIGVTLLLSVPINIIIHSLAGISGICALPWQGGVILVLISMLLTIIAGLIPSRVAAKKDPVIALRTE